MTGGLRMDIETLQALIEVYRVRGSADLLAVVMDEAEGPQGRAAVLELLRTLPTETFSQEVFAPVRREACQFCLNTGDYELAERLAQGSGQPEDLVLRARALHALGREQEAIQLYRQAIGQDPATRNRELERFLGIRPGLAMSSPPAKIISLTTYSSRRDNKSEQERRDASAEAFLDDLDGAVTFADAAGLEDIKAEVRRRIVLPYLKPSLFRNTSRSRAAASCFTARPAAAKR